MEHTITDHTITAADGRTVSYADFGEPADVPVIWCHGGPGSRHVPEAIVARARDAGIRPIGIDRPGYGESSPQPGRSIGGWVADAILVADARGLTRFFLVGVSTGGAYALATAALESQRVSGVLVCCGMTDMAWAVDHAMMEGNVAVSSTRDREAVKAIVIESFGEDGEKMLATDDGDLVLSAPGLAFLAAAAEQGGVMNDAPFKQGVYGYVDDRMADAHYNGWSSFDIADVTCPVIVIHGEQDTVVPVAHARHTAEIVTQAELRTLPEHGHFSVTGEVLEPLLDLIRSGQSAG